MTDVVENTVGSALSKAPRPRLGHVIWNDRVDLRRDTKTGSAPIAQIGHSVTYGKRESAEPAGRQKTFGNSAVLKLRAHELQ